MTSIKFFVRGKENELIQDIMIYCCKEEVTGAITGFELLLRVPDNILELEDSGVKPHPIQIRNHVHM
jgi:hypothetical protein